MKYLSYFKCGTKSESWITRYLISGRTGNVEVAEDLISSIILKKEAQIHVIKENINKIMKILFYIWTLFF